MDREKTIQVFEYMKRGIYPVYPEEYLDTAIEALSADPCEDTISRQAILDYIYEMPSELTADGRRMIRRRTLEEYISDTLPPVAPKQKMGRWIPVSERLPEESLNSVIGWDAYRERCAFVQYIDGHFQITGKPESFNIIAWMPLPEPYREESEDTNV